MISYPLFTVHIRCLILTRINLANRICLSKLFVVKFAERHLFASKNEINKKSKAFLTKKISYPLSSKTLLNFSNADKEGRNAWPQSCDCIVLNLIANKK